MDKEVIGNIFKSFVGLFTSFTDNFVTTMSENFSILLNTQLIVNIIGIPLILLYVIKKLRNNDFFEFKTAIELIIFISFAVFYNWSKENPKLFSSYLNDSVMYIANNISGAIQKITIKEIISDQQNVQPENAINALIQKTIESVSMLAKKTFSGIGITNFYAYIMPAALTFAIIILQIGFVLYTSYYIIVTLIEITIYKAFALLILPLIYFSQTRGFAWVYIKKVLSLTFYQPLILLLATLNFSIVNQMLKMFAGNADMNAGIIEKTIDGVKQNIELNGVLVILIIGSFLSLLLVKKVPEMINGIFGTQGGVQGMSEMGRAALSAGGAVMGGLMGAAKSGFKEGGGGLGGVVGAMTNMAGLGMGKQIGGTIGSGINAGINSAGKGIKSAVTKGVSFGTSQISKTLGKGGKK